MSSRFPFTFYPRGWFQVAYSDELPVGGVLPLAYFGKELVLFRTSDGAAHALDAYCPHLGAHLGHGGRVVEGTLQCPFHGWRLNGSGTCVEIPHATKIPPTAAVASWPVHEVNGLILVHHAPDRALSNWRVPSFPQPDAEGWAPYQRRRFQIRTHVQEIAENIVDPSHFRYVHDTLSIPETTIAPEGHVFRSFSTVKQPTPRGPVDGRIDAEAHGLGFWLVRFTGISEVLLITAGTPMDGERVDLRLSFLTRKDSGKVSSALVTEIARQVEEDIPIWENKIYRTQPVLSAGDGPIMALRKWSRQFLDA